MAALAVAELITNAQTPKAAGTNGGDEINPAAARDANATPPKHIDALVALLIFRSDLKSASALKGVNIAIDAPQSGVEEDVRTALVAAGASDVHLSVAGASPFVRLISGDVHAAVLKLVSPDAAEAFPEIKGFKVLRVPLAPRVRLRGGRADRLRLQDDRLGILAGVGLPERTTFYAGAFN